MEIISSASMVRSSHLMESSMNEKRKSTKKNLGLRGSLQIQAQTTALPLLRLSVRDWLCVCNLSQL